MCRLMSSLGIWKERLLSNICSRIYIHLLSEVGNVYNLQIGFFNTVKEKAWDCLTAAYIFPKNTAVYIFQISESCSLKSRKSSDTWILVLEKTEYAVDSQENIAWIKQINIPLRLFLTQEISDHDQILGWWANNGGQFYERLSQFYY